jgi:hypothetical protein
MKSLLFVSCLRLAVRGRKSPCGSRRRDIRRYRYGRGRRLIRSLSLDQSMPSGRGIAFFQEGGKRLEWAT